MNFIRSFVHVLWMTVTVVPWALFVVVISYFISSTRLYWICAGWLRLAVNSGTWILGIENRIQGMENLPQGSKDPAVLLVKHQSTWETFVMPAIMPHPLAYVFKKELLNVPFFGWAMGRMDMIHIDRKQRARVCQSGAARPKADGRRGVGDHVPRGHPDSARPKRRIQKRRCASGHRGRRACGPYCSDFGALLADQGLCQNAGCGGHFDWPRHLQ